MLATIVMCGVAGYLLIPSRWTLAVGVVGAITLMVHPLLGVVFLGFGIAIRHLGRIRRARDVGASRDEDGVLAVELVGLGVVSGLPFRSAASLTASELGGPVAIEITQALRSVGAGQPPATALRDIQALFNAAEISESTGMPLAGTITAMAAERRRAAAAVSRERLAKLPVKMLFPLAFLILPGFVLLTVVPPLISGLSNLGM
jgi:Flp pilus assembly protein TadB